MAKYPGSFIINEVGTRKELADIYGVSERTIYRWLNRAAKESGISPHPKKAAPTPAELAAFKGTRAQLAANYGVSPRTAYRWLAKARQDGTVQDNRRQRSKYPGADILNISGTNKEIAEIYDVSPRTVSRWKRKARLEKVSESQPVGVEQPTVEQQQPAPQQPQTIEEYLRDAYEPENVIEPPEEYIEPVYEEPIEGAWTEDEDFTDDFFEVEDIPEELKKYNFNPITLDTLQFIGDFIIENELINQDSIFLKLTDDERMIYITEYIHWQWETNPRQFNQSPTSLEEAIHSGVHRMDIWGDEFEMWLNDFYESNQYEI